VPGTEKQRYANRGDGPKVNCFVSSASRIGRDEALFHHNAVLRNFGEAHRSVLDHLFYCVFGGDILRSIRDDLKNRDELVPIMFELAALPTQQATNTLSTVVMSVAALRGDVVLRAMRGIWKSYVNSFLRTGSLDPSSTPAPILS
jgi:hypothetical protein